MTAPVGGTKKVIGNRIATPLTDPRPGMAPTKRPTVQPSTINMKLSGSKAIAKPSAKCPRSSIEGFLNLYISARIRLLMRPRGTTHQRPSHGDGRSEKVLINRIEQRLGYALGQKDLQPDLE